LKKLRMLVLPLTWAGFRDEVCKEEDLFGRKEAIFGCDGEEAEVWSLSGGHSGVSSAA
jgi:hypothetical protein